MINDANTVTNHWFNTVSGRKVSYIDTDPDSINIYDIAHSLSLQCRYNGHVNEFYSVAQHSVYVSWVAADIYTQRAALADAYSSAVRQLIAMWGLLHDAAEAYMGDLVRPLKHMIPQYAAIEDSIDAIIQTKYAGQPITPHYHEIIKEADNRVLAAEVEIFVPALHPDWSIPWVPAKISGGIQPYGPKDAKNLFLTRYEGIRHVG